MYICIFVYFCSKINDQLYQSVALYKVQWNQNKQQTKLDIAIDIVPEEPKA